MRRTLVLSAGLALVVGVGCKNVGGRCDCGPQVEAARAPLPVAGMAYPTIGSPVVGVTAAPAAVAPTPAAAAAPEKMPVPGVTGK